MEPDSPNSTAAGRLCAACGLCCNGVLFQRVRLLPGDVAQSLVALGFKIKRRKGHSFFPQPCTAFCESACKIYDQRPSQCRTFECRQLRWLLAGEITETDALESIGTARRWVAEVERLLELSGEARSTKSLLQRFENATAEPVDMEVEPDRARIRQDLVVAARMPNRILDEQFRNQWT